MSDDRTGRELTPRPEEEPSAVTPREAGLPASAPAERFSAGQQAHTVGLTEERAAQIVRSSSNARFVAFLLVLLVVIFIPIYWLFENGLSVVGVEGRLETEADRQYITDVSRGYALFLANCARCHGEQGQGGIGPPLNDQGKLYQAVNGSPPHYTAGKGHLSIDYITSVLEVAAAMCAVIRKASCRSGSNRTARSTTARSTTSSSTSSRRTRRAGSTSRPNRRPM